MMSTSNKPEISSRTVKCRTESESSFEAKESSSKGMVPQGKRVLGRAQSFTEPAPSTPRLGAATQCVELVGPTERYRT